MKKRKGAVQETGGPQAAGADPPHIPRPLPVSTAPNALTERVKELNCLYGISNLVEIQDVSLP